MKLLTTVMMTVKALMAIMRASFCVGSRSRGSRPIALSLRCAASVRRNMSDNGGNWISCLRVPTVSCHSRRVRATGLARARRAIRITSPERLEIGSRTLRATLFCRRVRAAGHRRVCALSRHSRRVRATCLARARYAIRTAKVSAQKVEVARVGQNCCAGVSARQVSGSRVSHQRRCRASAFSEEDTRLQ